MLIVSFIQFKFTLKSQRMAEKLHYKLHSSRKICKRPSGSGLNQGNRWFRSCFLTLVINLQKLTRERWPAKLNSCSCVRVGVKWVSHRETSRRIHKFCFYFIRLLNIPNYVCLNDWKSKETKKVHISAIITIRKVVRAPWTFEFESFCSITARGRWHL